MTKVPRRYDWAGMSMPFLNSYDFHEGGHRRRPRDELRQTPEEARAALDAAAERRARRNEKRARRKG